MQGEGGGEGCFSESGVDEWIDGMSHSRRRRPHHTLVDTCLFLFALGTHSITRPPILTDSVSGSGKIPALHFTDVTIFGPLDALDIVEVGSAVGDVVFLMIPS